MRQAGRWEREDAPPAEAVEVVDAAADPLPPAPEPQEEPRRSIAWAPLSLLALGAAWIGLLVVAIVGATPPGGLSLLRVLAWIGLGSGPLALLAVAALLLFRTGRSEATLYARSAARLRTESVALADLLQFMSRRIDRARDDLARQGADLATAGETAGERLARASGELRGQAEAFARHATTLDDATAVARSDLGVLLADLPEAVSRATELAVMLRTTGDASASRVEALAGHLSEVGQQAREADQVSVAAARRLAIELDRIEGSARAADDRIAEATARLGGATDQALTQAAGALEQVRRGLAEQGAAMTALVSQGRAGLQRSGDEAARALADRLHEIDGRVQAMSETLREHEQGARNLLSHLEQAIGSLESRFEAMGDRGAEQTADLAEAIVALAGHAEGIGRMLGQGSEGADALLARAEAIGRTVDASNRRINDELPQALEKLHAQADEGLAAIGRAAPQVERLVSNAAAVVMRIEGVGPSVQRQQAAVDGLIERTGGLSAVVARINEELRAVSGGASADLADALLRVRDTAARAASEAREALATAIPDAAANLAREANEAVGTALQGIGRRELDAVEAASTAAAQSAEAAGERLSRQLLAIAETSRALEARIAEHQAAAAAEDEGAFARQVGLLIEALNSTAIDVTKLLSEEPGDAAWAAYLKGDRGVFTRRAVRLLDATETREISRRYAEDDGFRDLVNRYVHDFEAMLRRVLAVREGAAMGVSLLSSDTGKLYVALAQAIERLR